ncbi:unnamed protein product [Phyllotreta striolata]|uniref:small monomeric GTPase n=1 Tax=Phyllotreta striolata TaxID=444603 RepID=A0A9N9TGY2_PHYSR|nr:unnamed protein product [Phyllotreta striolata]
MNGKGMRRKKSSLSEVKVAVIGAPGVGKSALSVRFLTRRYIGEYDHQSETRYKHEVLVDNEPVLYEILDTCPKTFDSLFETSGKFNGGFGHSRLHCRQQKRYGTPARSERRRGRHPGAKLRMRLLGGGGRRDGGAGGGRLSGIVPIGVGGAPEIEAFAVRAHARHENVESAPVRPREERQRPAQGLTVDVRRDVRGRHLYLLACLIVLNDFFFFCMGSGPIPGVWN